MDHTNFLNNCADRFFAIIQDKFEDHRTLQDNADEISSLMSKDTYYHDICGDFFDGDIHEFVDNMVSREYNGDLEQIVASYGIQKAYQLHNDTFGETSSDSDINICAQLTYVILYDALDNTSYAQYVEWFNINSPKEPSA
jgi:hypothetical protein